MNKDEFASFLVGMLIGCSLTSLIGFVVTSTTGSTYANGVEDTRLEALDAGVAEWPRNGEFKWKEVE